MFPNLSESKSSSLLNSTIEDIHDRSENEKDTPNKTSMKNVCMSQVGVQNSICNIALFLSVFIIIHMDIVSCTTLILCYIHITQLPHTQLSHTHTHTHTHTASAPKVLDFQSEVHATVGGQVTLRVNFTGIPKPTITWTFKGTKMEGDYAIELGTDGSLLFVCVETKHAGRYNIAVYCIQ